MRKLILGAVLALTLTAVLPGAASANDPGQFPLPSGTPDVGPTGTCGPDWTANYTQRINMYVSALLASNIRESAGRDRIASLAESEASKRDQVGVLRGERRQLVRQVRHQRAEIRHLRAELKAARH